MKLFNLNIEVECEIDIVEKMSKDEWIAFKDEIKALLEKRKMDILALYVYDIIDPKDMTEDEKMTMATNQLAKKIAREAIANTVKPNADSYLIPNTSKYLN